MLNFRKTNEPILRKPMDRRKDERKDGQTLFYRTLLANTAGPITVILLCWNKYSQ